MSNRPSRALTQQRLIVCILINQLATPGLGSLLAGRKASGLGQLALALAGFGLILLWMWQLFYRLAMSQLDRPISPPSPDWPGIWGSALFAASWCWALLTSCSLWLQAKKMPPGGGPGVPPRISEIQDRDR